MTDPTLIPAAGDPDPTPAPGTSALGRLGWRLEARPQPGFAHALAAGGGSFLFIAVMLAISNVDGDGLQAAGLVCSLALLVVALVAARQPGPARSAATTVAVLATPTAAGFALLGGGSAGKTEAVLTYLVVTAAYVALYLVGPLKGRSVFLGLGLLAAWFLLVTQVSDSGAVPFQSTSFGGSVSSTTGFGGSSSSSFSGSPDTTPAAGISLILGVAYLFTAALGDRRGWRGFATPFVAVGALATIVGAAALAQDESQIVGGILLAASGACIGVVGGLGARRASTWIGAIAVFAGVAVVVVDLAGDEVWAGVALACLSAVVLMGVSLLLSRPLDEAWGERAEGTAALDDPLPPPAAPAV